MHFLLSESFCKRSKQTSEARRVLQRANGIYIKEIIFLQYICIVENAQAATEAVISHFLITSAEWPCPRLKNNSIFLNARMTRGFASTLNITGRAQVLTIIQLNARCRGKIHSRCAYFSFIINIIIPGIFPVSFRWHPTLERAPPPWEKENGAARSLEKFRCGLKKKGKFLTRLC